MLNVKQLLAKIVNRLNPLEAFEVSTHVTARISINANTNSGGDLQITKQGYYPLAIVGWSLNWVAGQTALINTYNLYISSRAVGSGTVSYNMRNMHSATTQFTMSVYVLWAKVSDRQ